MSSHTHSTNIQFKSILHQVNGKWLPDFIERLKASAWHQLYLPLLPFTHARSESINADSLKLQLQLLQNDPLLLVHRR